MILTNKVAIVTSSNAGRMRPLFLTLITVLAMVGCFEEKPPIAEPLYVTLLTEASLIQAVYNVSQDSVIASTLFESVLEEYQVDKWDFIKSHRMYQLDLQGQERRWKVVLDTLTAQSQRLVEP